MNNMILLFAYLCVLGWLAIHAVHGNQFRTDLVVVQTQAIFNRLEQTFNFVGSF